ncbi:MAG TPA: NAD-dependent epimerase/dehydratase family protein, partial [Propionibacteriaceae bacterium]|nr:NAD-dependent epimerase/dehydratase family protein [Propionibacteriaceae bacterium]
MRLLILGGTAWLGGELARAARDRGYVVTCLARGMSGPALDGTELVAADRTQLGAYDGVRDRDWDAVLDVSRQPGQVRTAVQALRGRASRFLFVSSGNVYADHRAPSQDESSPLLPPLASEVMESMAEYGEAKVACERHVLDGFGPDAVLVARVGLIGGPGDWSGRT